MSDQQEVVFVQEGEAPKPKRGFYTAAQVAFGAFLGGPLAGIFMLAKNFKRLGMEDHAATTGFWGLILIVPFTFAMFLIPESVPGAAVPAAICVIFMALVKNYQQAGIDDLEKSGTIRFTHWRMIGVALAALLITLAIAYAMILFIQSVAPELAAKLFPESP